MRKYIKQLFCKHGDLLNIGIYHDRRPSNMVDDELSLKNYIDVKVKMCRDCRKFIEEFEND